MLLPAHLQAGHPDRCLDRHSPGEIVCIVGESGSGKTTFGRALLGLIKPSAGEIRARWHRTSGFLQPQFSQGAAAGGVAVSGSGSSFNPRQRIGAMIAEPRSIAGSGSTRMDDIAELAGKAGLRQALLNRFPHALSGGQARRAAVARAIGGAEADHCR
jgi:peptide/nickel transport system ATP-binding protein